MRQKTRKAATTELQRKAGTVTADKKLLPAPAPISDRQELVSVRAEQVRKGELSIQDFAKELKLTDLQLTFCLEYTKPQSFGDHITSYAIASGLNLNDPMQKQTARVGGLQLTKHAACTTLINCLLEAEGFTAENAKKQLVYLMNQFHDPRMKFAASKLFFEMHGHIKNHSEVTVKHQFDWQSVDPEKLEQLIRLKEEVLINSAPKPTIDFSKVKDFIQEAEIISETPSKDPGDNKPNETKPPVKEEQIQEPEIEDEPIEEDSDPWAGFED